MLSHQLRQICTQFDLPITYILIRVSDPLTKHHTCHPYTLLTLIDYGRGPSPCAALLDTIGNEILKNGIKANLMKSAFLSCNKNAIAKVTEILQNIRTLLGHGDNLLNLFNVALHSELEILAKLLVPSIVS